MVDMSDAMCDERNARCVHLAECWAHGRRRFRGTRRDDLIEGWGEGGCQCTGGSTRRVLRYDGGKSFRCNNSPRVWSLRSCAPTSPLGCAVLTETVPRAGTHPISYWYRSTVPSVLSAAVRFRIRFSRFQRPHFSLLGRTYPHLKRWARR